MKTFVIAGLHGDELFGLTVLGRLAQQDGSRQMKLQVGHPEAVAKGARYLETDLNRSFGPQADSIEARLARRLRADIIAYQPELLLDLHTSNSDVGKVAIVAERTEFIERAASALGMEAIVIMPHRLTTRSLVGCLPERALSLEFGAGQRSDALAQTLAERIAQLTPKTAMTQPINSLPVFEVYDEIDKGFAGLLAIRNLRFNKALQGYPFLAGATTYEHFGGFLARKLN